MTNLIIVNTYVCPNCGNVNPEHFPCEDPNGGDDPDDTAGHTADELLEEWYRGGEDEGN